MSAFQAMILGLVQGLGEFLPISSSGHLKLAEHFLGVRLGEEAMAFDVLLHVATLLAMVVYFRADLARVLKAWLRSVPGFVRRGGWSLAPLEPDARWGWLVLTTVVPTAVAGLLLKDVVETLSTYMLVVAAMLLVTGCLNRYADGRSKAIEGGRRIEELSAVDALICGLAQSVALFYGISRSGSTIAAGFARGLDRDAAPRFSFLMAIPAVAGAALLGAKDLFSGPGLPLVPAVLGFIVAAVSGYAALATVFVVVRKAQLGAFAWYCWAVGGVAIVALLLGIGGPR
jgi:undecaprenyl-diphosphatase